MTCLPIAYLIALGEARSCLAALADSTDDVDLSIHYDHLLIELDIIMGNIGPGCSPVAGARAELLRRLEDAVDRIVEGGVDALSLELLLVSAQDGPTLVGDRTQSTPRLSHAPN